MVHKSAGKRKPEEIEMAVQEEAKPVKRGPIENRGCTDIICCLLFLVCIIGMGVCGYFGFRNGDPNRILYPTDSNGDICGTGNYTDKPNLFFFNMLTCADVTKWVTMGGCPTPQVCVEECPDENWSWVVLAAKEAVSGPDEEARAKLAKYCKYGVNPIKSQKTIQELVQNEDCPAYTVKSSPIVGRCIPSVFSKVIQIANTTINVVDKNNQTVNGTKLEDGTGALSLFMNAKNYGMMIFQDVRASWWLILIGMGLAMILSFVWIILMRWLACPMVWLSIFLFTGLFAFATYYSIDKYLKMKDLPEAQGSFKFTTNLTYYTNLANTWLAFGIIAGIILLVTLLVILFLRTRIQIAIALIKEASRAVASMIFTLFWPIIPFILEVVLFAYWGAVAIFLASVGEKVYGHYDNGTDNNGDPNLDFINCEKDDNSTLNSLCQFVKYGGNEYTIYLQVYMLFMLFWVMNFIVALGQMTLAGAFASYYWVFDKSDIPMYPVTMSFYRSLRYHLGSLAFGSLLIAIVQMIRVFLEYMDYKLKGAENQVAKFLIKCLKCCFWCLEKFIKLINKNAFILIAIYGKNFCASAKDAFNLILRNIIRVAVVDKVTDFLLFIGKLMVTGAIGVLAFFVFSGQFPITAIRDTVGKFVPTLNFYLVPVLIITIGTYIIASAFFAVYSMGVDTLFLCFLEDQEENDGSKEKPYYMSKELMKILSLKNK